ncbi:hypothetical protein BsWGS_07154 [Bradybaena similaris]
MEVGTEISQKIRSAIKAKLLELGSYVDDELPDYIMVMVANKKTRAQMNGDLGLFLGTSTVAFTDWLHGLLEKLQTIRIEPEPLPGSPDKSENPKSKEKKKDRKSHKGDTSAKKHHKDKKKDSQTAVAVSDNATVLDSAETRKANSDSHEEIKASGSVDVNSQSQHESETTVTKSTISISEDFEDVRQLLVIEAAEDELTNELDSTEVEITHTRTVKNAVKPVLTSSGDATMTSTDQLTSSQSPERRSIQKKVSEVARKRKAPTSIVASINQNSEDEEYDPRTPAVGSVASVVRVTARKSSIPLPLQANRVLLMKAMKEAESSVAAKKKAAVTKPVSRDDSPSEAYSPKRKRDKSRDLDTPPPYTPSKKDSVSRHSNNGSGSQHGEVRVLSRNDARHMINKDVGRDLTSRSYREVVRTTERDRNSQHKLKSSRSPERSKRQKDDDRNVREVTREKIVREIISDKKIREINSDKNTREVTSNKPVREVKNDKNIREVTTDRGLKGDKNIQITCHLATNSSLSVSRVERKRQHSLSPEPKKPLQVTVQNTKSASSRLGKIITKRSSSGGDDRESASTRASHVVTSSSQRDARADIVARAAKSKSKENPFQKSSGGPVISSVGKEAVQKQCEAAVISVQAAQTSARAKRNMSPDLRVVECDTQSNEDVKVQEDSKQHKEEPTPEKRRPSTDAVNETVKSRSPDSVGDDDDLSKMIDEDLGPELLHGTDGDDFNLDLDIDDDLSNVVGVAEDEPPRSDVHESTKDDSKRGTRFIVTLDGIDERHFQSEGSGSISNKFNSPAAMPAPAAGAPVVASSTHQVQPDHNLYLNLLAVQARPLSEALLQQVQASAAAVPSKLTPPKIQPFSISLKDSDDEHDDKEGKASVAKEYYQQTESDVSAIKRAKMPERCKFWPACAAGSSCEFHHPTAHCKTFPSCKFGDKCLFIHPNCRFDSKCTRPDCPYTHTSRRPAFASATHVIAIPRSHFVFSAVPPKAHFVGRPSTQGICHYFPNCHNINCAFLHPKPCKFGTACNSPGCPFFHPQVPAVDKLKWQASSIQTKTEALTTPPTSVKVAEIVDKPSPSTTSNLATVSSTSQ